MTTITRRSAIAGFTGMPVSGAGTVSGVGTGVADGEAEGSVLPDGWGSVPVDSPGTGDPEATGPGDEDGTTATGDGEGVVDAFRRPAAPAPARRPKATTATMTAPMTLRFKRLPPAANPLDGACRSPAAPLGRATPQPADRAGSGRAGG